MAHPSRTYSPRLSLAVGNGWQATGHSLAQCVVTMAASSRAPVLCARKRKFEEDERQSIPNVLQGEVARLDPKFLVSLDPSHCSNNGTVHLICKLGEYLGRAELVRIEPSAAAPRLYRILRPIGEVGGTRLPGCASEQAQPRTVHFVLTCVQPPAERHTHATAPGPQSLCPSKEPAQVVMLNLYAPGAGQVPRAGL